MSQWAWEEGSGWTHTPPTPPGLHTRPHRHLPRAHQPAPAGGEGCTKAAPHARGSSGPSPAKPPGAGQKPCSQGCQTRMQLPQEVSCSSRGWSSRFTPGCCPTKLPPRGLVTVGEAWSTADHEGWPTACGTRAQASSMSLKDEQPVGALEAPGQRISEPCREWPVVSEGPWVILSLTNGVRGMDCGMLPSQGTFGSWQHLGVVQQARPGLLGTWPLWRAKRLLWGRRWALMAGGAAEGRGNVGL